MLLTTDILRLRCDVDSKEAPAPVTGGAMLAWLGRDLTFELGVFIRGAWVAPTNWTSLTIQILPANTQESKIAPTGTPTPLAVVTVSSFDASSDAATWEDGTKQQATVSFTAAQLNFSLTGAYAWLVVNLTLDTGQLVTPAAGPIELRPTGSAAPEAAPPDAEELLAYTKTEADARFAPYVPSSALTGGAGGSLDALATLAATTGAVPLNALRPVIVGGVLSWWQLVTGNAAENAAGGIVRPDDYATTTNEKNWIQRA